MNRRDCLITSAAGTGSALTMMRLQQRKYSRDLRPKRSRVAILHADKYSDKLDELVYQGLRLFKLDVRWKSVLLKPNIVEYIPGRPVNTDPQLIGAAAEAFLRLGAASVTSLGGNPRKHSRYLRDSPPALRHRGRDHRNGRRWTAQRRSQK